MSDIVASARAVGGLRISRFALVGATCAGLQFVLNAFLRAGGIADIVAFVVSFVLSAQVNFLLSDRFTWGSRRSAAEWSLSRRWLGYNASTLLSLVVSSTVFSLAASLVDNSLAVLAGIAGGAVLTFLVGDRVVFAPRRGRHRFGDPRLMMTTVATLGAGDEAGRTAVVGHPAGVAESGTRRSTGTPHRPTRERGTRETVLDEIPADHLAEMLGRGIAVFLPCYNEAANLPVVVANTVTALRDVGVPFQVIIVDDGSRDDSDRVARSLCETYDGAVILVSHEVNRGYGDALRTGFTAGLAGGWDWVGFLDSDNQFDSEEIKRLIAAAYYEHVDLVAGYRIKRADGFLRRLNGRLWHLLSRLVVGIHEKDVDCGFKLVHRNVLESIDLRGSYAAVSPELLAKCRRAGFRSAEVGVHHYPRMAGEQTGADLKVVLNSLASLVRLRLSLSRSPGRRDSGRPTGEIGGPPMPSAVGIGLLATLLSVGAFGYFMLRSETLLYDDSISHLIISRRLIDGSTPGLAQLGSVWLPLPHLLVQPGIWLDAAYYTGVVGSLLSMAAFVVATVYLFKTAFLMTGSIAGAWIAGLLFALNPNILYLQSTPMTETLLFAGIAGSIYQLQRWSQTERWQNLAGASLWIFLASLTRYEGWVLLGGFVVMVTYILVRRRYRRDRALAGLVFFGVLGAAGVAGWLLWNRVIFGSFTDFATGQFAKSSLWVGTTDVAVGDLPISLRTYASATGGTIGLPLALLGVAGVVAYLWRGRLRPDRVAPLALLIFFPFFVVALYTGQRPLHVMEITGDLYNTRFGAVMLIPTVLFAAYLLVGVGRWVRNRHRALTGAEHGPGSTGPAELRRRLLVPGVLVGAALLTVFGTLMAGGVWTLQEPRAWAGNRAVLEPAANALQANYDGGKILMQGFGNEYVTFASRVPASETIYEGSYLLWEPALAGPLENDIRWIYLSRTPTDLIWQAIQTNPEMASYHPVFDDGVRVLYERG